MAHLKNKIVLLFFLLLAYACQHSATTTEPVSVAEPHGFLPPPLFNATMQNMQKELFALEPYIFARSKFNDPANQKQLGKQIHNLAEEAKNVKHDPTILLKDPTVRFVSIQFADELQKADENFKAGWIDYSRSQLANVTSYCLECHTRLKEGPASNPHDSIRPYLSSLPDGDQIEFMIAFRQFEPALKLAMERLKQIRAPSELSFEADRVARLALTLTVQYLNSPEKTKDIVVAIEKNSSLPLYLKQSNQLWKKSLAQWNPNDTFDVLPKIRNLLRKRISEIEDMRAIAALLRLLPSGLSREELGEALYLTGESYESLHKISVMSLHENYYESCIRQAAHTKWGPLCFDKLADSVKTSYSGSSGTHIPADVKDRLEEFRKVIDTP